MICADCHKNVENRNDQRIALCIDCWNNMIALADIGKDIIEFYNQGKFDADLTEIIEKNQEFNKKWTKITGLIFKRP